mmetsp:Transcript_78060/g.226502  ORF Transcript_78060/g.226502 Transcript_78060/m.226502 type:complete len:223 (+) Transcript_78060:121-789(+)
MPLRPSRPAEGLSSERPAARQHRRPSHAFAPSGRGFAGCKMPILIAAIFAFFLLFNSPSGQRWQNGQRFPLPHPRGFQNQAQGLQFPVPWFAAPAESTGPMVNPHIDSTPSACFWTLSSMSPSKASPKSCLPAAAILLALLEAAGRSSATAPCAASAWPTGASPPTCGAATAATCMPLAAMCTPLSLMGTIACICGICIPMLMGIICACPGIIIGIGQNTCG